MYNMTNSKVQEPSPALTLLKEKMSHFVTVEGIEYAMNFVPRSTDVIISTSPKCGTTWMQQILHQLRSGGDMSFADIDEHVPFIDLAYFVGQDLDAEHKYQPRCFKTHFPCESCPKGANYIVIFREPCAAFYSSYNFFSQGNYFQSQEISVDEFVRSFHLSATGMGSNYFKHLLSWWPHRNDPNVLFLLYEEMLQDLESSVRAVASFIGIDDEARIANAVKMSTFDYMKQYRVKFMNHLVSRSRNKAMGFPEETRLQRVASGPATKALEMMEECTKLDIQKMWTETIGKELGFHDYKQFRETWKKHFPVKEYKSE
ncbi:amine sulfotransferase-like [Dendronephthya gigantea]|uniref:amine sulfotransferase-like n=1 Tax=Dendronephthya gigantea TaxID=151771 RepID=UPI00106A46B8|nr:amine sulfotransferase-like [Dendronephthya gigantea]